MPTGITYRREANELELSYDDGSSHVFSSEYLRVFSPSADVRGHGSTKDGSGAADFTLPLDKQSIKIVRIEPVGNYAIRLVFSDGHSSGIYSWQVFAELAEHRDAYWAEYQRRLSAR